MRLRTFADHAIRRNHGIRNDFNFGIARREIRPSIDQKRNGILLVDLHLVFVEFRLKVDISACICFPFRSRIENHFQIATASRRRRSLRRNRRFRDFIFILVPQCKDKRMGVLRGQIQLRRHRDIEKIPLMQGGRHIPLQIYLKISPLGLFAQCHAAMT